MRLSEWIQQQGRGEITRLMRVTNISYATVYSLAHDRQIALFKTAKVISDATGGAVSIAELCQLPQPRPQPAATTPLPPKRRARRKSASSPKASATAHG